MNEWISQHFPIWSIESNTMLHNSISITSSSSSPTFNTLQNKLRLHLKLQIEDTENIVLSAQDVMCIFHICVFNTQMVYICKKDTHQSTDNNNKNDDNNNNNIRDKCICHSCHRENIHTDLNDRFYNTKPTTSTTNHNNTINIYKCYDNNVLIDNILSRGCQLDKKILHAISILTNQMSDTDKYKYTKEEGYIDENLNKKYTKQSYSRSTIEAASKFLIEIAKYHPILWLRYLPILLHELKYILDNIHKSHMNEFDESKTSISSNTISNTDTCHVNFILYGYYMDDKQLYTLLQTLLNSLKQIPSCLLVSNKHMGMDMDMLGLLSFIELCRNIRDNRLVSKIIFSFIIKTSHTNLLQAIYIYIALITYFYTYSNIYLTIIYVNIIIIFIYRLCLNLHISN
jgi:hypothetical protein